MAASTTTGECVLLCDLTYEIPVHNAHDLTDLITLLPNTPFAEKEALKAFVKSKSPTVNFGQIIPSNSIILTDAQMETGGWNNQ